MAKSTTEKCNPPGGTLTDVYHTVITDGNGDRHEGYGNSPEESGRVASRMRDYDSSNESSSSSGNKDLETRTESEYRGSSGGGSDYSSYSSSKGGNTNPNKTRTFLWWGIGLSLLLGTCKVSCGCMEHNADCRRAILRCMYGDPEACDYLQNSKKSFYGRCEGWAGISVDYGDKAVKK